jgi:K+-sensing histidine kinase KdpD
MSTNLSSTLNKLNGSASSLWEFTDRFFTWAITQQEDFEIQKTTFPLQEIFDTVASFYAEIVKLNDNQLLIHSTKIICTTDKNILPLIIRNIVDNANKNTTSGCITLKAATVDNHLLITIQDEGKGLSQNEMAMFMQKDRLSQISENKTGFGSQVIQTMVLKIDAHLFIESTSKGSTFTIRL